MITKMGLVNIHHTYRYNIKEIKRFFFLVMSRIYPQQLLYIIYSSVNYLYHVHYIPSTYLSYNYISHTVPFDCLHPILLPPPPASDNHKSDLFLQVCLFVEV